MRRQVLLTALLVLALAGCGSGQATTDTDIPSDLVAIQQTTASTPTAPPTTTAAQAPSYPIVHFTNTTRNPHGVWPFTAQLASITENPNGFTGTGGAPPGDTYLEVQVNIVSLVTGRTVPPPQELEAELVCHGFHEVRGGDDAVGYDQGSESAPDRAGFYVAMGDGQPHPWDEEWLVPEQTPTARIKCVFGPDPEDSGLAPLRIEATGPTKLN
jgi:hypothetical protein